MAHPDPSWRIAAIYRCCVRYGKDREWCYQQLEKIKPASLEGSVLNTHSTLRIADIWFRKTHGSSHMTRARQARREWSLNQ